MSTELPGQHIFLLLSDKTRNLQWVPGLSRGKGRPSRDADPSPPSSAMVKKEWSYTSTSYIGRTTCTEPQCLYECPI